MTPSRRSFALSASSSADRMVKFAKTHDLVLAQLSDPAATQAWPVARAQDDTALGNAVCVSATKAMLDRLAAAIGLILLYPLFLAIALIIRLESPGPALFTQPRIGFRQQIIWRSLAAPPRPPATMCVSPASAASCGAAASMNCRNC
jgi:hypothetical protein